MKNREIITLSIAIITGLVMLPLTSCNKTKEYEREEEAKLQAYLASNPSLNFDLKESGLYYLEIIPGTGLPAVTHDTAYVFYTAKLLDGTELYTNAGTEDTLIFAVGEGYLISGLDEGVKYMNEGGQSLLMVPSKLAYGATGDYYYIGGYTPLLFEVELIKVKQSSGKK